MRQSREERNQVCNGSHLCLQTRLAAWIWQGGFGEVDLTKWIWQTGFSGFAKRIQQAKVVII